jgi:hypothetical protein
MSNNSKCQMTARLCVTVPTELTGQSRPHLYFHFLHLASLNFPSHSRPHCFTSLTLFLNICVFTGEIPIVLSGSLFAYCETSEKKSQVHRSKKSDIWLTKKPNRNPLRKVASLSCTHEFPQILWNPKVLLLFSQEPSTGPYTEPNRSSP